MKRLLTFVAISGIAAISAVALNGCASTRIKHVSGAEFLKYAENTALPQSFVWDNYIGSTDQRAYLEYGHPAFIGKGKQMTVFWTELSELPSNIVAQIRSGERPWRNVTDRIGQPSAAGYSPPATGRLKPER